MRPQVSIVMPVLNGRKYIAEAIGSILAQTYKNYELIVVDDGSTDDTPDIVRQFAGTMELRCLRHPSPMGIAPSMNDGVRHATGDMIAFLDHDDAWLPGFLETQVSYLEQHPDTAMVHSDFQTTDVDGNVLEPSIAAWRGKKRPNGQVFPELFLDSFIVGNSVLIRKECFERLGLFDESLRWGDYHMWMRIARHYRVDYVDQVLTQYRQHPSQSTRTPDGTAEPEPVAVRAIRKILELYPEIYRELGRRAVRRRLAALYFDSAWAWWTRGAPRHARPHLREAIALWPGNLRWRALYVMTFLRPSHRAAVTLASRRLRAPSAKAAGAE